MIATRGGVALLWLSLDRTQEREAADAALLAPDELVQGALLRDPEARHRFVRRRALLRRVLGHVLDLPPGALRFERGPRGKPRLAPALAGDLHFSASSTGARLLLAIGRGWVVGTDLVSLGCAPPPRDAWPLVFGREAADGLSRVPARLRGREALALWAETEAVLKLTGDGLAGLPTVPAARRRVAVHRCRPPEPGYVAAVALHEVLRSPGGSEMAGMHDRRRPEEPFLYWPSEAEVDAALGERRAGGREGGRGLIRRKLAAAVSVGIRAGRLIAITDPPPEAPPG